MFSPREPLSALLRATPLVVSIIDLETGPGEPELVRMKAETTVHRVRNLAPGGLTRSEAAKELIGAGQILVHYTSTPEYRHGAPL
jgi:hypothetical protein